MVMSLSSLACAEVVGWSNREVVAVGCSHIAVMTCTCSLCEKKVRGRAVTLLTSSNVDSDDASRHHCLDDMPDMPCRCCPSLPFIHWAGDVALVFAGSVAWTEKKTETEPNTTEKDRTNGCGCTNSEVFWLRSQGFM